MWISKCSPYFLPMKIYSKNSDLTTWSFRILAFILKICWVRVAETNGRIDFFIVSSANCILLSRSSSLKSCTNCILLHPWNLFFLSILYKKDLLIPVVIAKLQTDWSKYTAASPRTLISLALFATLGLLYIFYFVWIPFS